MKYYCLHHTPANERKEKIKQIIEQQNLQDVEWIEDFLPDSDDVLQIPKTYSEYAANGDYLSTGEISLFLKHRLAFSKILNSQDYGLVIEDDIENPPFSFNELFPLFIDIMENNEIEFLSIGSCCGLNYNLPQPGIISNSHTKARCTHCYLIKHKAVEQIIDFFEDIICPIDWQISLAIDKFNIISGWSFPYILQNQTEKSLLR